MVHFPSRHFPSDISQVKNEKSQETFPSFYLGNALLVKCPLGNVPLPFFNHPVYNFDLLSIQQIGYVNHGVCHRNNIFPTFLGQDDGRIRNLLLLYTFFYVSVVGKLTYINGTGRAFSLFVSVLLVSIQKWC